MNSAENPASTPYLTAMGGVAGVHRLVEAFYARMETLPEAAVVRAMHLDMAVSRRKLELYLVEWLGGPKDYSQSYGPPRLRARHLPFAIGPRERDAWMTCMRGALEEVVLDDPFRQQLEQALLRTANAMINRPD